MTRTECQDPAHALLDWYLNGTLEAEEEASVAAHLRSCSICSRELAELASVTQGLAAHGMARELAGEGSAPRTRRRPVAYAVAAVLAVSLALVLHWVYQGPSAGSATTATASFALDLGHGPVRGDAAAPAWVIPAGALSVAVSFIAPVSAGATDSLELRGPDGAILLTGVALEDRDEAGAYACTFPAQIFTRPGEYVILVRRSEATGEALEYSFPFRVSTEAP